MFSGLHAVSGTDRTWTGDVLEVSDGGAEVGEEAYESALEEVVWAGGDWLAEGEFEAAAV